MSREPIYRSARAQVSVPASLVAREVLPARTIDISTGGSLLRLLEHDAAQVCAIGDTLKLKLKVGASVGISVYPEDGHTVEALLAAADEQMYQAKVGG